MIIGRPCLVLFALLIFSACQKGAELPADNGCISQISQQNYSIKSADSVSSIQLMKQNGIPCDDIQLEYVASYSVPEGDNAGNYQSVFVIQLINRLPILSSTIWYQFKNGTLISTTGTRYTAVRLDTHPAFRPADLRAIFLSEVQKHNAPMASSFRDSCLVAQFGYYDLNALSGGSPNIVKAWVITTSHRQVPQVTVEDGSGTLINYNAGFILF